MQERDSEGRGTKERGAEGGGRAEGRKERGREVQRVSKHKGGREFTSSGGKGLGLRMMH